MGKNAWMRCPRALLQGASIPASALGAVQLGTFFTCAWHKLELKAFLALPWFPFLPLPSLPFQAPCRGAPLPRSLRQRLRTGGALYRQVLMTIWLSQMVRLWNDLSCHGAKQTWVQK